MSLFLSSKELAMFKSINEELIDDVIQQTVMIYSINTDETEYNDLYGESINKVYSAGVTVNCLILFEEAANTGEIGGNIGQTQNITLYILKDHLTDNDVFFREGDIVFWDSKYYEITYIESQKRIQGLQNYRWDIRVNCTLTDLSSINISN